jgi:hypothetical protein
LSSSLKCYSETQIPAYLTSNNSLNSGIDRNNFSQFPNPSDNGTHSPLLHSPTVSSSLRESSSVSTQALPSCWTTSSHDINMTSSLNSTSGFPSRLDFQQNSGKSFFKTSYHLLLFHAEVAKNLPVGVPIYNSNTYDNIGSNLRLCNNSTTQRKYTALSVLIISCPFQFLYRFEFSMLFEWRHADATSNANVLYAIHEKPFIRWV